MNRVGSPEEMFSLEPFDQILKSVINRLRKVVEERFGCRFEFYLFCAEPESDPFSILIHSLLSKNTQVFLDGELFVGVQPNGILQGYAKVSRLHPLTPAELRQVHELIALIINPTFSFVERLVDLHRLEDEIRLSHLPSNVLRLRKPPGNRTPSFIPQKSCREISGQTSFPYFIEAQSYSDIQKMAVAIHDFSKCPFFVHFSDLSNETKSSSQFLLELGNMTIFIPEIAHLQPNWASTLQDYLNDCHNDGQLQIIAGTVFEEKELIASSAACSSLRGLIQKLSTSRILMREDFKYYQERGLATLINQHLPSESNPTI